MSLSKAQLCVLTCNACNSQTFTRSDRSDYLVRQLLHKAKPATASSSPVEPPAPAAPAPVVEVDPVPAAPAPAPVTKRSPFGLIGM